MDTVYIRKDEML